MNRSHPHQEETFVLSYLEYNQRAVPQITPQLLIPLLHIPKRIRRGPELRHTAFPVPPTQRGVFRYRQAERPFCDVVRPPSGHCPEMFLCFLARSCIEGWIEKGRKSGEEVWGCDVRNKPWDEFRAARDGRCEWLRGSRGRVMYIFHSLEDHL